MKILRLSAYGAALALCAHAASASDAVDASGNSAQAADVSGPSGAVERDTPMVLSDAQLDGISAGDLGLPSGRTVFAGFDNPAPNTNGYVGFCNEDTGFACHPALTRRSTRAAEATFGHGVSLVSGSNEGPWSAALNSDAIDLLGI